MKVKNYLNVINNKGFVYLKDYKTCKTVAKTWKEFAKYGECEVLVLDSEIVKDNDGFEQAVILLYLHHPDVEKVKSNSYVDAWN